jgi:crotonobetainyl-CoA:carnitine CoA-transferase CaiB-like acyl-CoA transferase
MLHCETESEKENKIVLTRFPRIDRKRIESNSYCPILTRGRVFYFMEPQTKQSAGLALIITGLVGLIFGHGAKSRGVKIASIGVSIVSICTGYYLFVGGLTKPAARQVDGVGETFTFQSSQDFQEKLDKYRARKLETQGKDVRRLKFSCADGSESFTVYLTAVGSWNVPSANVICEDGSQLLAFNK